MKKKLVSILALLLALTLVFAACQSTPAPTPAPEPPAQETEAPDTPDVPDTPASDVTLRFAMWDEVQAPIYREILDLFTAETGIEVEIELTPWAQYWVRLDAAAGADDLPDVFWMNTFMPRYAEAGVLRPLTDLVARDGVDMAQWTPGVVELYTRNGDIWGLPVGHDVVNVYFNRAIFENYGVAVPQPGWTWEDMVAIGEELRDAIDAAGGHEYALVMELDPQPSHFNFVVQNGGYILAPGTFRPGFDLPQTVQAYQDVIDLMESGVMPSFAVLSDTIGIDIFSAERAAMIYAGSWRASVIDNLSFAENIGIIQQPSKAANNHSVLGGMAFTMNATTDHVDEAWQLIQFLAGYDANRVRAETGISMPAYLAAYHHYTFNNIDASVILAALPTAFPFPTHERLTDVMGIINDVVPQIWAGMLTPEAGAEQIQARLLDALGMD